MAAKPMSIVRAAVALETLAANSAGPFWGVLATNPNPDTGGTLVNTAAADTNLVLGGLYRYGSRIFKYVQFKDAVTYAAGQIVFPASADGTAVTNDVTGGSSLANAAIPVGVVLGVQTQNYYGFILQRGSYSAVKTNGDDDIAAGINLFATAADGGVVDSGNGVPLTTIGWSTAADVDAADTVAAYVNLLGR